MDRLLDLSGSVHHGRLVKGRIDAGKCRQINDRVITEIFPDIADDHRSPKRAVAAQKIDGLFDDM